MRILPVFAVTILSLVTNFAHAGSMRKGLSVASASKIGYVEVVPSNTAGKFAIFFSADEKRYLIIDQDSKTVEFSYADATALRNDILKTSFGQDVGATLGCQEREIKLNGFVNGCQLILFEYK